MGANPVPVVVRPTLTRRLHAVGAVHSLDILDATPPSAPPMPCGGVSAKVVAAPVRVMGGRLAGSGEDAALAEGPPALGSRFWRPRRFAPCESRQGQRDYGWRIRPGQQLGGRAELLRFWRVTMKASISRFLVAVLTEPSQPNWCRVRSSDRAGKSAARPIDASRCAGPFRELERGSAKAAKIAGRRWPAVAT